MTAKRISFKLLLALLEDRTPSGSRAINDAKALYAACMDTNRINAVGSRELLHTLEVVPPPPREGAAD